ncbi:MAG: SIMPL domain-containing protein [Pseudomonadota bacterium]
MIRSISIFILCVSISNIATAHESETLFNRVNLQAQANMEIPNDEIQVILAVEKEGNDAASIANEINKTMEWALAKKHKGEDVNLRTLSYNTYPVYKKQTIIAWRASQQLEIKGTSVAAITELAGELQVRLQIKSMRFMPSVESRKKYENLLIDEAMLAFEQRVELVKKHMEDKNIRIIDLNINTGNQGMPRPVYAERMMTMDSIAKSAPAVEAGTSLLTVTVNGSVQFY